MSKNHESGPSWVTIAIFLAIPGLRFIGVFLLLKKLTRLLRLAGKNADFLYIIAAVLLFGSAAEIFSFLKGVFRYAVIPISAAALGFFLYAKFTESRHERLENYVSCLCGENAYSLNALMSEMGVSEKKLRRDIKALKKKGQLPKTAYIDEGRRLLILRPEGKPVEPTHTDNSGESPEETEYRQTLLEIRALSIVIDDEAVSAKIDRIEQITSAIFEIVRAKPERREEIQTFLEYYLPTTLKLLRHYSRLERQTVEGENILDSRAKIEGILSKLVSGFEKQLDLLFHSDAIDITSDVKVLEKMMQMDGLSN